MITGAQLRAARALLGIDQRGLAALSQLSVPTIQRMEGSEGVIRGNVDSLMKLVGALDAAGIEFIGEGMPSQGGGRGVRLREPAPRRRPPLPQDAADDQGQGGSATKGWSMMSSENRFPLFGVLL